MQLEIKENLVSFSFCSILIGMKNYIFDLDGTTLDTLEGIRVAINTALKDAGYSYSFDKEGTKELIGEGADTLIHRALKESDTPEAFSRLKEAYMPLYHLKQESYTFLFPGQKETLEELKRRGAHLYICTNKPDAFAKRIVEKMYGNGLFEEVCGQIEGLPVKPDPRICNYLIEKYHLDTKETLFVGDSKTDVATAKNSSLPVAICLWGYGFYTEELLAKCDYIFKTNEDLLLTYHD